MAVQEVTRHRGPRKVEELGPHYKWIALSNTTIGILMATINSSIVLIALPDIFRGININPLEEGNTSYLLWMIMGFLVVTAVLVVGFGRLGDMYGRVRMYNMGFAVFTISSILLAVTWMQGAAAAWWLIGWRIIQGIGGAFLFANSSAILTDAFPVNQRGMALGINSVAAISGSFIGLVIGGVLAPINWHLIFLVSVPVGIFGTVWAYLKLHDTSERRKAKMDWWGNVTFAIGLIVLLIGITYGIQPYGGSSMGWTSPLVLSCVGAGVVLLVIFGIIETKVQAPLFNLSLFRIRAFAFGNIANLLASLARGGLQFIMILWLQGIWLPQHGFSFAETPLWAGIAMLPLTVGFLVSAPVSGIISDRIGSRWLTTGGLVMTAVTFFLLAYIPVNFDYWQFAVLLFVNGVGMGLFSSPNRADVMNSLPANARGAGAGMTATFQNSAMVLSIGVFFSLIIAGLSQNLPHALSTGLQAHGVSAGDATRIAGLPAVAVLFAAFLGYNPIQQLLGPVLSSLSHDQAAFLTGRGFFPQLISGPFSDGLTAAFWFAIAGCLIAAVASWLCAPSKRSSQLPKESLAAELAEVAGEPVTDPQPAPVAAKEQNAVMTASLSGGVRTPGGAPVAGAVVTVTGLDGGQIARAQVDASGTYAIASLRPGPYTLIGTAPGFRPEAVAVVVRDEVPVTQDFVLSGNGTVTGFVRSTATGQPVKGAAVLAINPHGDVLSHATTNDLGHFSVTGLPAGDLTITVNAEHFQPIAAAVAVSLSEPSTLDLRIAPVGGLSGHVSAPGGGTVEGAIVTVIDPAGQVVGTARTDSEGSYRIPDVPSGDYTVVANLYQPAVATIRVNGGVTSADLAFSAPAQQVS
nr:MFS transporter [Fodinicola acaciae]